jgi:translation initiation factor 5B
MSIRSPIVSVLGHVDHGKSSLLDAIRDSNILATEAGAITQAIGASIVPIETIKCKCGVLLEKMNINITIPGLLFIDTPGHAAFTSLRKRGGSLADIAIVVIDINEGFKPQTLETIEILKSAKTPFVIAANKLDLSPRYRVPVDKNTPILKQINEQSPEIITYIETKLYNIVGTMHEKFSLPAERFDRVEDFTKEVAIIPISAKLKLGLSELLMVISALTQKYLENNLLLDTEGYGKGTILEVKEEQGMGTTLDVILYNGNIKVGDTVVIGGLETPIITKIRALFEPAPLNEMRDKKSSFSPVKKVIAATGVKISCPDIDSVLSGMPIQTCENTLEAIEKAKEEVQKETQSVKINTKEKGIMIKADNIGSLEALAFILNEKNIPIRKATVGPVTKKDLIDAEASYENDPLTSIILGFNIPQEKSTDKVKILTSNIIYHLIEEYEIWIKDEEKRIEEEKLKEITKPCKIQVLQNCIFRQSNPCIVGVEVKEGTLRQNMELLKKDGSKCSFVKSIGSGKENLSFADKGVQVAIGLPGVTAGRQINEEDILYSDINETQYRKLKEHKKLLNNDEIELLKEISEIKRKVNPLWGG